MAALDLLVLALYGDIYLCGTRGPGVFYQFKLYDQITVLGGLYCWQAARR
jgi:hypothetical protein